MSILTDNFNFQPEELIRIDGVLYAVFYDTNEELGDFPILAEVEFETFLKEGALANVIDLTEESFADKYGYVFRGHADLYVSDMPVEGDAEDYRVLMDLMEAKLDKRAKEKGMEWLLDVDVQGKFLAAVLTGKPVSQDDLSDTQWYKTTTPEQRDYIAEFYSDPDLVAEKIMTNTSDINVSLFDAKFKGDTSGLAKDLAYGLTTKKYTAEEVEMYIGYLGDKFYLEVAGGEQILPVELRKYVGQFETTDGIALTESIITQKLGRDAIEGYKNTGEFAQMVGMVRNGQSDVVKNDLQKVHDNLYPAFAGSSYSTWNPFYSNRAANLLYGTTGSQIVKLTKEDQTKINDLIIKAGGDYNKFDGLVRKEYQDAPGIKNAFLDDLARAIPQSYSGVF